jgi:hypothetical protein
MTAFLQALLQAIQVLATGGAANTDQLKTLVTAGLALTQGYLAAIQPAGAGTHETVVALPGVTEPVDPNDPNSSAMFIPVTVPISYFIVAGQIKQIAAQTQNEQWAAGAMTMISLMGMVGGA